MPENDEPKVSIDCFLGEIMSMTEHLGACYSSVKIQDLTIPQKYFVSGAIQKIITTILPIIEELKQGGYLK